MAEGETVSKESETNTNKEGGMVSDETSRSPVLVTEDMAAAAGFNVRSPIVNAIIQNLTNHSLQETEGKNSQEKCCSLCNVACMTSDSDRVSHILGRRHKNKLLSLRIIKNLHQVCKRKTVLNPAKGKYVCPLCKVTVNSPIQLVSHMRSMKHINTNTKTGIVLCAQPVDDLSYPTVTYFCQYCKIHLTSDKQMLKHRASLIHLLNLGRINKMRNTRRVCR